MSDFVGSQSMTPPHFLLGINPLPPGGWGRVYPRLDRAAACLYSARETCNQIHMCGSLCSHPAGLLRSGMLSRPGQGWSAMNVFFGLGNDRRGQTPEFLMKQDSFYQVAKVLTLPSSPRKRGPSTGSPLSSKELELRRSVLCAFIVPRATMSARPVSHLARRTTPICNSLS